MIMYKEQVQIVTLWFGEISNLMGRTPCSPRWREPCIGVNSQVVKWSTSFLSNKTEEVAVDGFHSNHCSVTSGVPQGSVIGPSLFLIYINDLPSKVNSEVGLFADEW